MAELHGQTRSPASPPIGKTVQGFGAFGVDVVERLQAHVSPSYVTTCALPASHSRRAFRAIVSKTADSGR